MTDIYTYHRMPLVPDDIIAKSECVCLISKRRRIYNCTLVDMTLFLVTSIIYHDEYVCVIVVFIEEKR